jgi:hypothetical protein
VRDIYVKGIVEKSKVLILLHEEIEGPLLYVLKQIFRMFLNPHQEWVDCTTSIKFKCQLKFNLHLRFN